MMLTTSKSPRPAAKRKSRASRAATLDEQLRRIQRLVMQGELAATAVHEISNLQTIVLFNAGLLQEQYRGDKVVAHYIDPLLHAATLVATLCNQLRNLAHPAEPRPQRLDLAETALRTHGLLSHIISRKLEWHAPAPGPITVLADPGQVEQMLINLVLNARDATPEEGGIIRIRVGTGRGARPYLEVEDNGTGMTPQIKARLFQKFFTTKQQGKGTGLGLVTVHRLLEGMGGRIELQTRPNRGARFRLVFPVAPEPSDEFMP